MSSKKNDFYFLLYIPALLLGYDFLPLWYMWLYTLMLGLLVIFKVPNIFSYINFFSSFFIFSEFGKRIIPETMVPLLGIFIMSRLINNKNDDKFEVYPLFLWICGFSVFSSGFYYLTYASVVIGFLFLSLNSGGRFSVKEFIKTITGHKKQLIICFFLSIILFIFFPRMHNFLPSSNVIPLGKIGYSKEVNNSQTANLNPSQQTSFYAELSTELSTDLLYWRGRVLNYTDGYNWKSAKTQSERRVDISPYKKIRQNLKYEQDFENDIILLDIPGKIISTNLNAYHISSTNTFQTYTKKKKSSLTVDSILSSKGIKQNLNKKNRDLYLQLPKFIPKKLKTFLKEFNNESPELLIQSFKKKLLKDQFVYTLSPGFMPTMSDFLDNKKGYCTHFASLLGVIFRYYNIPSRLITGFQGGKYNQIGNYFEVKSNDAHAWVEYYDNNHWKRVDPTSFVSPARIQLGGQDFLTNPNTIETDQRKNSIFGPLITIKQYFDTINYKVSLFLDGYDQGQQRQISKKLNLKLKYFFYIGIFIVISLLGVYYFLFNRKTKQILHPADKILQKLDKMHKRKLGLMQKKTIADLEKTLKIAYDEKSHPQLDQFLLAYEKSRYAEENCIKEMEKQLSHLEP